MESRLFMHSQVLKYASRAYTTIYQPGFLKRSHPTIRCRTLASVSQGELRVSRSLEVYIAQFASEMGVAIPTYPAC
jgi:hypothetical protein